MVADRANERREQNSKKEIGKMANRRKFLSTSAIFAVTGLAGCISNSGVEELSVTGYPGPYADGLENEISPLFKDETGAELVVNRVSAEHISEIQSAPEDNPPYDAAAVTGLSYKIGRNEDLWLDLRHDNIPNQDAIYDYLMDFRPTEVGLPVTGGLWNMVYRDDLDWEPETWGDLTEDQAENVALRSDYWNFPVHVAAVASQEAPLAEELQDESMHDAVFDFFDEIDSEAWISSAADMWELFNNDVIDIGMSNTEETLADERVTDGDYSVTIPTETAGYLDMFVVVRGTDKRDLAEEYINFMLSREVQETWAEVAPNLYSNSNIQYPDGLQELLPTTEDQFQGIAFPDWNTPLFEYRDDLAERFNSNIAGVQ